VKSPRYRWAKPGEFDESDGVYAALEKKEAKARKRRKREFDIEEFDVKTWRLPEHWRKDRRVGDDVMRKLTDGCQER